MTDAEKNGTEMTDAEKNGTEMTDAEKNGTEMTDAEKKGLAVMAAGLAFTNAATAGRFRWVVAAYWLTVTVYWFTVLRSLK